MTKAMGLSRLVERGYSRRFPAVGDSRGAIGGRLWAKVSATGVMALTPAVALAAGTNPILDMVTNVIAFLGSGTMTGIATLVCIALGIAAWTGKLTWDHAVKFIIGIVFVFGASGLVSQFSGWV